MASEILEAADRILRRAEEDVRRPRKVSPKAIKTDIQNANVRAIAQNGVLYAAVVPSLRESRAARACKGSVLPSITARVSRAP